MRNCEVFPSQEEVGICVNAREKDEADEERVAYRAEPKDLSLHRAKRGAFLVMQEE